jgi:hypothetical protein
VPITLNLTAPLTQCADTPVLIEGSLISDKNLEP